MPQANQFLLLEGQVKVRINGASAISASRVACSVSRPVSKQKSATMVGIAMGIPDPTVDFTWMTPKDRKLYDGMNLALLEEPVTIIVEYGAQKYQISGAVANTGGIDNDPGQGTLNNTGRFEAAFIKQIA